MRMTVPQNQLMQKIINQASGLLTNHGIRPREGLNFKKMSEQEGWASKREITERIWTNKSN